MKNAAAALAIMINCSCGPQQAVPPTQAAATEIRENANLTGGVVPDHSSRTVYKVGGDVTPPRVIKRVQVEFPAEVRDRSYELGVLVLTAVIDEQGRITKVEAVNHRDHPLTRRHIEALKQWQFEPATLHGKPVAAEFSFTVGHFPVRPAP